MMSDHLLDVEFDPWTSRRVWVLILAEHSWRGREVYPSVILKAGSMPNVPSLVVLPCCPEIQDPHSAATVCVEAERAQLVQSCDFR